MLTHLKRQKLLAGLIAAVMTTSIAGCGSSVGPVQFVGPKVKPKGYVEPENPVEERDEAYSSGGGYFYSSHGYYYSSNSNDKSSSNSSSSLKGRSSSSKLGSTGSSGKSGIGSGMSRLSGSAIS